MQVANNNLFKRLKKRKMKDSILNSITWIVSSFGFIVFNNFYLYLFLQKVAKLYLLIYFLVIIQKQLIL